MPPLRVWSYSGRKPDERPLRFQLGEHEYAVDEIVDQWYSPDATFFKIAWKTMAAAR